jgi:hypothetical protein
MNPWVVSGSSSEDEVSVMFKPPTPSLIFLLVDTI